MAKKTRKRIPPNLETEVLFASDRTCCVCREPSRPVQLHHIDGDRSNNARTNLAVLCKDCHAAAHTKIAFARNLTPDLIKKYNETWQEVVQLRLQPQSKAHQELELQQDVLLEITLIPHSWKMHYMSLYPGSFMGGSDRKFEDIWDKMREEGEHPNTEEEWRKYPSTNDPASSSC